MTQQFTASEVRAEANEDGLVRKREMLHAYADLLEAREKAEPVAWGDYDNEGHLFSLSAERSKQNDMPLYIHPSPADESAQTNDDAEQLWLCREDWQKVCDVIHPGWHFNPEEIVEKLKAVATAEKLAEALRAKIRRLRNMPNGEFQLAASVFADDLERILTAHSAQAQPPAASVADGFASWGDWLESLTDDELVTIFYHYPDAANRMERLLAATPQPAKESDR